MKTVIPPDNVVWLPHYNLRSSISHCHYYAHEFPKYLLQGWRQEHCLVVSATLSQTETGWAVSDENSGLFCRAKGPLRCKDGSEDCPGGGNREPLSGLEQRWREAPRKKVDAFKVGLFACQMGSLWPAPFKQVKAVRLLHPLALIFHHNCGPGREVVQCARSSQEAAGEIHALWAGAEAWRPEPGEQAGAGIKAPLQPAWSWGWAGSSSPLGSSSLGLSFQLRCLGKKVSVGPAGLGQQAGERYLFEGWETAWSACMGPRERYSLPGEKGCRKLVPQKAGGVWGLKSKSKPPLSLSGSVNWAQVCCSPLPLHPLSNEAQLPQHIQWFKRILPLLALNTCVADNKLKHKLMKLFPSPPRQHPRSFLRKLTGELTLLSKRAVISGRCGRWGSLFNLPQRREVELSFTISSSTSSFKTLLLPFSVPLSPFY